MKKIIPVSLLAIWVACPAMAENFPNDGYMLENKTYDNAATYENMGVDNGSVDAVAEYANCPANSYCDASGQHSCPSGYPNSAAGSSESTQCYTACTVQNANIAHATAVTGNNYDGGADTCSATACEDGYHVDATGGSVPARLDTVIGEVDKEDFGYINNDRSIVREDVTYGLTENNSFALDYGSRGVITGRARCSTRNGVGVFNGATVPDEVTKIDDLTAEFGTGRYCYCQVDSYTPVGGEKQSLSGPWVFSEQMYSGTECADKCAGTSCATNLSYGPSSDPEYFIFRVAVLSSLNLPLSICEANTITINWSDVDGDGSATTLATDVLYDGDIDTPVKATTYPGKTFVGWRFVRPDDEYGS